MTEDKDKPDLKLLTKEIFENLTEREKKVLKERFGIDLEGVTDIDAAKIKFDVTRERIRQIEEKALKMLRKSGGNDPDAA